MLVVTEAQREARLHHIEAQKAHEASRFAAPVSVSVAQLVRDGRAMKARTEKCGKRVWQAWEPSDALRRLLTPSPHLSYGQVKERVLFFCAEADGDRSLRELAAAVGIDPDQWREWIDYAC